MMRINKFIEYCELNDISFISGQEGYIKIQKIWFDCFFKKLTLKSTTSISTLIRKKSNKILFIKEIKPKRIDIFKSYCLKNNIIFNLNEKDYNNLKKVWFNLFNITLKDCTCKSILKKIKKLEYNELYIDEPVDLKKKIIKFCEHCIENSILFHRGKKGYSQIKEVWEKYNHQLLSINSAMSYTTKIKKLGYSKIFIKLEYNSYEEKIIKFSEYCILNFIKFNRNKDGYYKMQRVWNNFFKETIPIQTLLIHAIKMRSIGYDSLFVTIDLKINKFIEYCELNDISFISGQEGYIKIQKIWFDCFSQKLTLKSAITIPTLIRKKSNKILFTKKIRQKNINVFIEYCLKNSIIFNEQKEKYSNFRKIWFDLFSINLKISTIKNRINLIKKLNYKHLFIDKPITLEKELIYFSKYCIKNHIIFEKGKTGYFQFQKVWNNNCSRTITLKLAQSYCTKIRNLNFKEIFVEPEYNSFEERIEKFVTYCRINNLTFPQNKKGYIEIQEHWYKCTSTLLTMGSTKQYALKIRKAGYTNLFYIECEDNKNHKIKSFIEYCKRNSINFHIKDYNYHEMTKVWEECFSEKLSLTTMKNYIYTIKKYAYKDLFTFENTSKHEKLFLFAKYCMDNSINLQEGKEGYTFVQGYWEKYHSKKLQLSTICGLICELKKLGFIFLFETKQQNNKNKIATFINYCISNKISFSLKKMNKLEDTWYKYFSIKITKNITLVLKDKMKRSGNCLIFSKENTYNKDIVGIVRFLIRNGIYIDKKNLTSEKFKEIWLDYYEEEVSISDIKTYKEQLLKQFNLLDSEKTSIFNKFCRDNFIAFSEKNIDHEKLINAWKECFKDE